MDGYGGGFGGRPDLQSQLKAAAFFDKIVSFTPA